MTAGSISIEPAGFPDVLVGILLGEVALLGTIALITAPTPPWTYPLGWAGVGSMLIMQAYSFRRRLRFLRRFGSLKLWLDIHIFLGIQGFILVGYHSIGVSPNASLAAINFALVSIVVVSGLFGRYIYSHIPRARHGAAIERAALEEAGERVDEIAPCRGILELVRSDWSRRRRLATLARDPTLTASQRQASRRAILLASRLSGLDIAERWFSRWTLFHRPLAYLLLGITVLHILAHYAYAA